MLAGIAAQQGFVKRAPGVDRQQTARLTQRIELVGVGFVGKEIQRPFAVGRRLAVEIVRQGQLAPDSFRTADDPAPPRQIRDAAPPCL
jgi:hypothetical protein